VAISSKSMYLRNSAGKSMNSLRGIMAEIPDIIIWMSGEDGLI
jgi:hypothetical protein